MKQTTIKNLLYLFILLFSLTLSAQEDDGADLDCESNGPQFFLQAWDPLCFPVGYDAVDGDLVLQNVKQTFVKTSCDTDCGGFPISFHVEYYTVWSLEYLPDGYPNDNGAHMPGSNQGLGSSPLINVTDLEAYFNADENGIYDQGFYIPLWQTGIAEFNDNGLGDGLSCLGTSGDFDFRAWFEIYGPDGVGVGMAADPTTYNGGGNCGTVGAPGNAPLTVDFGSIYQGGVVSMTSSIDGVLADISSTGPINQNFGATVANSSDYPNGVSSFEFTIDPSQMSTGLHILTFELNDFDAGACNSVINTIVIEILDCDTQEIEDENADVDTPNEAIFDYVEAEGCADSGADDNVIWIKGGGTATINPGPLCMVDPINLPGGISVRGTTWDFGLYTNPNDGIGIGDGNTAPSTCVPGAAPAAVPCFAESFADIDPGLTYVSANNLCDTPIEIELPQNNTCQTIVWSVFAYQFLYALDADCDENGEYNPDFPPIRYDIYVLPNDPITEVITQPNVCSEQPNPIIVRYGHDLNGDGHLENCNVDITGIHGVPDGIVDDLDNEVCFEEMKVAAMENLTCGQLSDSYDYGWTAAEQQATFCAPTDACYTDINGSENFMVNAEQPTFQIVGLTAEICSGATAQYTVEVIAADGSVCGSKSITQVGVNTTCGAINIDLDWEYTDAELLGILGQVNPTALTGACPEMLNDPQSSCIGGGSGTETITVYSAQLTAVANTNITEACSGATDVVSINLEAADGTICDTKMYDASPNEGCTANAENIDYEWTVAEIETITGATSDLTCYTPIMGSEVVNVYPEQYAAVITNLGDVCTEATNVLVVDLFAVDGSVCDTKTYNAPANTTCTVSSEMFNYEWTTADLEGLSGAPSTLACYTPITGTESVNVYPAQLTAAANTVVADACSGATDVVIIDLEAADGTVCDTKMFDAAPNEGCSLNTETINYEWTVAEIETLTGALSNLSCQAPIAGTEMVNLYPAQYVASVANIGDVCTEDTDVLVIELQAADGTVCDTKTYDAPANTTCTVSNEMLSYEWTTADLEGLSGASSALACYTPISGTESVNVYPAQLTAIANTVVADACSGATDVVVIDLEAANGTVCDTKMYDAVPNESCTVNTETINYEWTVAEIETLTGALSALSCYAPIMGSEVVNVYPAQYATSVTSTGGVCTGDTDVLVIELQAADGTVCDTKMSDAPGNESCTVSSEILSYEWTTAELEGLSGASSALTCYTPVMGTESVNVYPAQLNAVVNTNVGEACSGATDVVIVDLEAADGTVCDTKMYDAAPNDGCALSTETFDYEWTIAEMESLTGAPPALACYVPVMGSEVVNIYPEQYAVAITNIGDVCTEATAVLVVDLLAVDGSICDTKSYDAPANTTCTVSNEIFSYEWTTTELETLTGAPSALNCYTPITGTESINVYPAQLNAVVNTNVGDACSEATDVVIIDLESANGTVCDTKMYDAAPNEGCELSTETFDYEWTATEIETLTGAPTSLSCYAPIMGSEVVNIYPAQYIASITSVEDGCTEETDVLIVGLLAVDGTICDTKMYDAPANNTCVVSNEILSYEWTAAELEGLTGTPSALACYTPVTGTESINVYPAPLTAVVNTNVGDACSEATDVVIIDLESGDGTVCDTKMYDAAPNEGCDLTTETFDYEWSLGEIEVLIGALSSIACYTPILGSEVVNVYPAQYVASVNNIGDACTEDTDVLIVDLLAVDGTVCDTETYDAPTNNTCVASNETLSYEWTTTDLETLTGAPSALACYTPVTGTETVSVFPDASTWVVTETQGDCGLAATVSIDAGALNCFSDAGSIPPVGTCPSTDGGAPLTYSFDPMFPAECNMVFGNTINATCSPVDCCPDIAPDIATQVLCAREEPDFSIIENEVNASGSNIGGFTYFMDAGFTIPYAPIEIMNSTCDPMNVTIYGRLECTNPDAPGTVDEFDNFTFILTVYPDANNFTVTEVAGACNIPASVSITAENGDECFAEGGEMPVDPGCNQPDDVQNCIYSFDPGFLPDCNMIFENIVLATCATTSFSSEPDFECPPANVNYCDGGILELLPVDLNEIDGATGTFSGTALPYIMGSQNPGEGAVIDVATLPTGIQLTLEYTITTPGCIGITTTSGCSFIATVDCDADAGRF